MPVSIRPYRRFPVERSVTYNARPFQGQGTVTLPNEQRIEVPEAVVR